jgi:GNAT superfamily N-acetyltransferase
MAVTIRFATERDVPVIWELVRALAVYEGLGHRFAATEALLREALYGVSPAAEVLLAEDDAVPVGIAIFFGIYSTFLAQRGLYLEDLYVREHARGKGIGGALLRRVAEIALERGCARIEWSVLDWNDPSIQFYKQLGAEPLSDWTRYRLTGDALSKLAAGS